MRASKCCQLSVREQQIVDLISQAKRNKEIARQLYLTEGTVRGYIHHIFRKLNVTNRTELALRSQGSVPQSSKFSEIKPLILPNWLGGPNDQVSGAPEDADTLMA